MKILKYTLTVLKLAWDGALTIFTGIVMTSRLFKFVDKFLDNNVFLSCLLAVVLITITLVVGDTVKNKMKSKEQ